MTQDNWRIRCINRTNTQGTKIGEGFEVFSPDGITYTLMQPREARLTPLKAAGSAPYVKAMMLVSQAKDRFGNSVTYHYSSNGNLLSISSNDGRNISLTYNADGLIGSVTANGHQWSYDYACLLYTSPSPRD